MARTAASRGRAPAPAPTPEPAAADSKVIHVDGEDCEDMEHAIDESQIYSLKAAAVRALCCTAAVLHFSHVLYAAVRLGKNKLHELRGVQFKKKNHFKMSSSYPVNDAKYINIMQIAW